MFRRVKNVGIKGGNTDTQKPNTFHLIKKLGENKKKNRF
jgi:hypothetical protein